MRKRNLALTLLLFSLTSCSYGNSKILSHDNFVNFYNENKIGENKDKSFALGDKIVIKDNFSLDEDDSSSYEFSINLSEYEDWVNNGKGGNLTVSEKINTTNSEGEVNYDDNASLSYTNETKTTMTDEDEDGEPDEGTTAGKEVTPAYSLSLNRNDTIGEINVYSKETYNYSNRNVYYDESETTPDYVETTYLHTLSEQSIAEDFDENKIYTKTTTKTTLSTSYVLTPNSNTNKYVFSETSDVIVTEMKGSYDENNAVSYETQVVTETLTTYLIRESEGYVIKSVDITTTNYTYTNSTWTIVGDPVKESKEASDYDVNDFDTSAYEGSALYQKFINSSVFKDVLENLSKKYQEYFRTFESYMDEKKSGEQIVEDGSTYLYRYPVDNSRVIQYRFINSDSKILLNEIALFSVDGVNVNTINKSTITY